MAKTTRSSTSRAKPAPADEWSADALAEAVVRGTPAEKRARLRRVGILTAKGTLAPKYKNWGTKVSRTPDA